MLYIEALSHFEMCFLGFTGILWWILYQFTVYSSPHDHPRISADEKTHILTNIGEDESSRKDVSVLISLELLRYHNYMSDSILTHI